MARLKPQNDLIPAIRGCASWQDIQTKWRNFPEKQKGDLFEELVKAYLQLDPESASKLKHVWLGHEVPQATARKLKLPATDQGIDIVAETELLETVRRLSTPRRHQKGKGRRRGWRGRSWQTQPGAGLPQRFQVAGECARVAGVKRGMDGEKSSLGIPTVRRAVAITAEEIHGCGRD